MHKRSKKLILVIMLLIASTLFWGCMIGEYTYEERSENLAELKRQGVSYGQVVEKIFPELMEKYTSEEKAELEFYRYDIEKDPVGEYLEAYKEGETEFLETEDPVDFNLGVYSCPVNSHIFEDIDPKIKFLFQRESEELMMFSYEYANEEQFIRIHVSDEPIEDYGLVNGSTIIRYDTEIMLWSVGNLDHYWIATDSEYYLIKVLGDVPEDTLNLVFYRVINFW